MAFAAVQTTAQTATSGNVINRAITATGAGNLVVVHCKIGGTSESLTSVTDTNGNTFVVLSPVTDPSNTYRLFQAYGVQVVGGSTNIQLSFSGAVAAKRAGCDEYSGGAASNAAVFDASTTGSGTGTSLSASTLSPAASGELIVASLASKNARTWTAGTDYTIYNGSGSITVRSQYRLSGTASETGPASIDSSDDWAEILTAFKPPAAGGTTWPGYQSPFGWR